MFSGLTDPVLEAAANKGLLRRAHRDRAAGLVRLVSAEAGGAVLKADGETVRLGPAGLAGATCTCPAEGVCRHVLAAVIEMREGAAAPAANAPGATPDAVPEAPPPDAEAEAIAADLAKHLGRSALRRAEAILAAAVPPDGTASVEIEAAPGRLVIRIPGQPEVHYVAGLGPAGMIARDGDAALHAAALLALRRVRAGEPVGAVEATPAAPARAPAAERAFLGDVADALREAARTAIAHAPAPLERRLLDLSVSSRAEAMPNLSGALRAVAAGMARRRARDPDFDPGEALAAMARAYALTEALRAEGADPALRGEAREGTTPLSPLDLIGLGVTLWEADGARGATAHFLAPGDDGPRPYSATLARAAGQDPAFTAPRAATEEPIWGATLDRLARGAFRLEHARAGAEGRIAASRETRAAFRSGTWAEAMAPHGDMILTEWDGIAERLRGAFAPTLRRTRPPARPLLLAPATLGEPGFDPLTQETWLPVMDRNGWWLRLRLEGWATPESQLDTIAAAGAGGVPTMAVLARAEGPDLVLRPVAVLRGADGVLDHLDLPLPRPPAPPDGLLARLRRGLDALRSGAPARFVPAPRGGDATDRLLAAVADETLALAELGGRMDDPDRLARLARLAERLDAAGLGVLATPLERLAGATDRPHHLLVLAHLLACHRALSPSLPFLHRLP